MHVKVERRHIEAARKHALDHKDGILYDVCRNCPMAQALREVVPNFDSFGYTEIKFKDGSHTYIKDPDNAISRIVFKFGHFPYTNFPELEFDVDI